MPDENNPYGNNGNNSNNQNPYSSSNSSSPYGGSNTNSQYSSNYNSNNQNKVIDVTKPRESRPSTPMSNIDSSRVSDYTLREQQSLERLTKKLGGVDEKKDHSGLIKTIIAIVLVIILIILAIVFIVFIGKDKDTIVEDYDMRLSMQIENKSFLSVITETGREQLREINPGDRIGLRATVRNAQDITGEKEEQGAAPPSIYVRFKIVLILDYVERYDIIVPSMQDCWYKYDKETEDGFHNGAEEDDHYYYYVGALKHREAQELFSSILFDGDAITCDDGGKYGQIQVHVECIEADLNNVINGQLWPTAPQGWVVKLAESGAQA